MHRIFVLAIVTAIAAVDLSLYTPNVPGRDSRSNFLGSPHIFHLLKKKFKYPQVEKIPTSTQASNCICVPYYQCDINNTIITDGSGSIDPRTTVIVRRVRCPGDLEVCCKPPAPSMQPIVNPPVTTQLPTFATQAPVEPPTEAPTQPPTEPATAPPTDPPTEPPTDPPTQPPTDPPTQPPTDPPTQPPTDPPTDPPTQPPTDPPTQPPADPPTQPPTDPPTQPPTDPPTEPPTEPPTDPPTKPPTNASTFPPLNCVCVPAAQCDANGYVVVGGEGTINPRLTLNPCPVAGQVCCTLRTTNPVTTLPVDTLPTLPAVPPGQPLTCVCVHTSQCDRNGYIIVSGAGNISPRYPVSRQAQVAGTCVSANEICCKIPPNGQDSAIEFPNGNNPAGNIRNAGTPQACLCVKSWQCAQGNVVYLDGAGVIDPRFGACPCADEVCCLLRGMTGNLQPPLINNGGPNVIITNPNPQRSSAICGFRRTTCLTMRDCETGKFTLGTPVNNVNFSYIALVDQTCATNPGETSFAEFPWMVALLIRKPDGTTLFLCGASMINTQSILTAAHCVLNRESGALVARFGEWNTADNNEPAQFQEAMVLSVITHPQYYSGGLYNDVAVLILARPVAYAINVMPICLPQQGMLFAAGLRCWATGWGRSAFEGQYQTIMRQVDLPIIDRTNCQKQLRATRLGQYFQLHGSFICAGGELNRDTCRGDGGGPLVCPTSSGQYVQAGIVAWGIGCGESNTPAVYANVASFRLWIDQQLANYGVL